MSNTFDISAAARWLAGITGDPNVSEEVQLGAYMMWEKLTGTHSDQAAELVIQIALGPQVTAKTAPF